MLAGNRNADQDFGDRAELFYRRCDPAHLDEAGRVFPVAVSQYNLSVLRSRYATNPDHARWDSRVDAANGNALVYPDWPVIQFTVNDATQQLQPENQQAQPHSLRPVHEPLADNYAHCELGLFRGAEPMRLVADNDAKGAESKRAKREFRTRLAERATVRLKANEGSSYLAR
jgi:hypothetical protein